MWIKFSAKTINKAINLTAIAALVLVVLYVFNIIDESTLYLLGGFFGLSSIAAFRELFASEAFKSRLILIAGLATIALFGYGYLTGSEFVDLYKLKFALYVIFGLQIGALAHGAVKANFQKVT